MKPLLERLQDKRNDEAGSMAIAQTQGARYLSAASNGAVNSLNQVIDELQATIDEIKRRRDEIKAKGPYTSGRKEALIEILALLEGGAK